MFPDSVIHDIILSGLLDSEKPGKPGHGGTPCPTSIMCLSLLIQGGIDPAQTNGVIEQAATDGYIQFHDMDGEPKGGITLTDTGREAAPASLERLDAQRAEELAKAEQENQG